MTQSVLSVPGVASARSLGGRNFFQRRRDPREGGLDVFARVERADPHVAFAAFAETGAGRADDLRLVEQQIEKLPGVAAGIDPDVRRVVAADAFEPELGHRLADELRVA